MILLETVEVTLTGLPGWAETLAAFVLGLIGPWLVKNGYRVVVKPKAAATAVLVMCAMMLSGCGLFQASKMDANATAANLKAWDHFGKQAEKWWADAGYPESVREGHRIGIDEATDLARTMDARANE